MKKILLMTLSALLLIPVTIHAEEKEQAKLKVMSYNIRLGSADDGTYSWQFRYPATGLMLEAEQPDLFGLQEALSYQIAFLEENFKKTYRCYGVGREDGRKKGEFMSIFYNKKRLKIGKKGTFWLSGTPDRPSQGWDAACKRTATWAFFTDKESKKKFIFVNTHLDHIGEVAREEGLKLILQKIEAMNSRNLPVILCGDFNVLPQDKCLKVLEGRMQSARETAVETDHHCTYNAWGREHHQIIDYIYISGQCRCKRFQTITKKYGDWKYISDHYPVCAEIEL